jgi:hypothetical protein
VLPYLSSCIGAAVTYLKGDVVWYKMRHFKYWPCTVERVTLDEKSGRPKSLDVKFINYDDGGYVSHFAQISTPPTPSCSPYNGEHAMPPLAIRFAWAT